MVSDSLNRKVWSGRFRPTRRLACYAATCRTEPRWSSLNAEHQATVVAILLISANELDTELGAAIYETALRDAHVLLRGKEDGYPQLAAVVARTLLARGRAADAIPHLERVATSATHAHFPVWITLLVALKEERRFEEVLQRIASIQTAMLGWSIGQQRTVFVLESALRRHLGDMEEVGVTAQLLSGRRGPEEEMEDRKRIAEVYQSLRTSAAGGT